MRIGLVHQQSATGVAGSSKLQAPQLCLCPASDLITGRVQDQAHCASGQLPLLHWCLPIQSSLHPSGARLQYKTFELTSLLYYIIFAAAV